MDSQLVRGGWSQGSLTLEERVHKAVNQLSILTRSATLDFALSVGKVVIDTLYDGELSAWRSRLRKDHALRALAASPDLPMSASALYRALAIYELSQRQTNVTSWKHLGVCHLRTVLGLPTETQDYLLTAAEAERWTVAKLEREVLCLRAQGRNVGGRKPLPRYVKSIRRIFDLTLPEALDGLETNQELSAEDVTELLSKLNHARERLQRVERILSCAGSPARSSRHGLRAKQRAGCPLEN
jgi:hypothetical protein